MPRRELRTRRERRAIDRASQWRPQFVGQERRRIGHDVDNLGLNLRAVTTERDEVPDELVRELDRPAERHAKADEVFGVHGFRTVSRRAQVRNKCVLPCRKYVYSATGRSNCSKRSLLIGASTRSEKSEIREFAQARVAPFPQGGAWRSCPDYV